MRKRMSLRVWAWRPLLAALLLATFILARAATPTITLGQTLCMDAWSKIALESSNVIWVPDNCSTIQAAVYAADAGDTVMVRSGLYYENVIVNQTVRLVGLDFPIVDGSFGSLHSMWGYPTFWARANNVSIEGFIVQHGLTGGNELDFGIYLCSGNCNATNNIVRDNLIGVLAGFEDVIENNSIRDNDYEGIFCSGWRNTVCGNIVSNNGGGISTGGPANFIINNIISNNKGTAISLMGNATVLRGNNMTGNGYGFDYDGGPYLEQYLQDIDTSNLIDSRPMYYWINQHDKTVPQDAGYVALVNCTNITLNSLDLKKNGHGVLMAGTSNSTIADCNIANNTFGLFIWLCENNTIHHNNFVNNSFHVGNMYSPSPPVPQLPPNIWDSGYPSGGNYWSPLNTTDLYSGPYQNETGSDGLNDTAYTIDANNQDNYPLAAQINIFDAGTWNSTPCEVQVISNSSLSDFQVNEPQKTLSFNVTGPNGFAGFCRVTIPRVLVQDMWQGNYAIMINGQPVLFKTWADSQNTYAYFAYQHSELRIVIIPEFPQATILPATVILSAIAVMLQRRTAKKNPNPQSLTRPDHSRTSSVT